MENIPERQTPQTPPQFPACVRARFRGQQETDGGWWGLRGLISLRREPASRSCEHLPDAPTYGTAHPHEVTEAAVQKMLSSMHPTRKKDSNCFQALLQTQNRRRGCRKEPSGPAGPRPRHELVLPSPSGCRAFSFSVDSKYEPYAWIWRVFVFYRGQRSSSASKRFCCSGIWFYFYFSSSAKLAARVGIRKSS